jgi:hypothetical protein
MQDDKTDVYFYRNNGRGFMVSLDLSQTMVAIMLQDDKSTHKYHALMVNFL